MNAGDAEDTAALSKAERRTEGKAGNYVCTGRRIDKMKERGEAKTMRQYVCSVCGYVYAEEKGIPQNGIAPGTKWEELPDNWICPLCGAGKQEFREKGKTVDFKGKETLEAPDVTKELSAVEMSVICSNLSRGCEKQYLLEEAEGFQKLADFFRKKAEPVHNPSVEELSRLVEQDLQKNFPYANETAAKAADRGALRSLVWSEKVTRMLKSLLSRYETEGEAMLENTGVYVCTICGFVYVGKEAPQLCPVCKVPGWKFEKLERRTA